MVPGPMPRVQAPLLVQAEVLLVLGALPAVAEAREEGAVVEVGGEVAGVELEAVAEAVVAVAARR